MIRKRPVAKTGEVKVTFELPADRVDGVSVVGDFNDWEAGATPLRKRGAARTASVTLTPGRRYAFRYYGSDGTWLDDDDADDYEANEFGGRNCIVDLT